MSERTRTPCWLYRADGTLERIDVDPPTDPLEYEGRTYTRCELQSVPDSGHPRFFLYAEGERQPSHQVFAAALAEESRRRRGASFNR